MSTKIKHGPMYEVGQISGANRNLKDVCQKFPEAKYVADAHESIKILVRDQDIRQSTAGDHTNCAMAVACRHQLRATGAHIGMNTSYLVFGKLLLRFQTPESVRREIVSFDRNDDFRKGAFGLSRIIPSNRLFRQRRCKRGPHKTKAKASKRLVFRGSTMGVRTTN